jgi:hypothetical protein
MTIAAGYNMSPSVPAWNARACRTHKLSHLPSWSACSAVRVGTDSAACQLDSVHTGARAVITNRPLLRARTTRAVAWRTAEPASPSLLAAATIRVPHLRRAKILQACTRSLIHRTISRVSAAEFNAEHPQP